jgi:small-conductance mechanosensitive channel
LQALRFLLRRGAARIDSWRGTRLRALRFQSQDVLSEEETTRLVQGGLRGVGWVLYALLFYTTLSLVLGFSPATRGMARTLLDSFLGALQTLGLSILNYLPNLFFLIVLFFAGRYAIRLIQTVFGGIGTGRISIAGFDREWAGPTFRIVRMLIVVFLAIIAIPYLPAFSSPAFQGISIFVGVLVSLGSSGAVANAISGIVLTYTSAFRVGDRVRLVDTTGDVIERTTFVTRIRTIKNVDVAVPNAAVLTNPIVNFSARAQSTGIILHPTVTIGYGVAWQRVHELLVQAARDTEAIEDSPEPFVLQSSLDDFYVRYELNAYTRDPQRMALTYSDLYRNIQERFHAAGVEIASPHLSAFRDGNAIEIPSEHLPRDYQPASFRLLPLVPLGSRAGGA